MDVAAALGAGEAETPKPGSPEAGPSLAAGSPEARAARAESPVSDGADGLCERDRELLAFERHWWRHAGAKEQAIRERFGMSATRYYQLLNVLLDRPEALVADPMLVKRLRRLRSSRQKARAARRSGGRS